MRTLEFEETILLARFAKEGLELDLGILESIVSKSFKVVETEWGDGAELLAVNEDVFARRGVVGCKRTFRCWRERFF